jgi:2-keto-myo-inositol isomerase
MWYEVNGKEGQPDYIVNLSTEVFMRTFQRFALNRIVCPDLPLREFMRLAHELGVSGVELRNDLGNRSIIDSCTPAEVRSMAEASGITMLSINALQRFNLLEAIQEVEQELVSLVDIATKIGCKAIVLCPNNDVRDQRSRERMQEETVACLKALRHYFEESGLLGMVEPLGFSESSLRSKSDAMRAIAQSVGKNYRIVHDTFHHVLGPDSREALMNEYDIKYTGLVHISGVESDIPCAELRDPQRLLISSRDRLGNKEQIQLLTTQGYRGSFSFEPFAHEVQGLDYTQLKGALKESLEYLASP